MRLTVLLLLVSRLASAQPTRLLAGALSIELPPRMTVVANKTDSYGYAVPGWAATRAELTLADGAIVMVARDTFVHPDGEFRRSVVNEITLHDIVGMVRPLVLRGGGRAVTVEPPPPRRGDLRDLIHAAYVVDDNSRVLSISFYAVGGAYDNLAEWTKQIRDATASIELAERWSDPPVFVSQTLGTFTFEVTPPLGWTVVPLKPQADAGGLIAYEGGHLGTPAAVCGVDGSLQDAPATSNTGRFRFLGELATWRTWVDNSEGRAEIVQATKNRSIRAWCRLRNGRGADALVRLRTLVGAIKP